jgi:hypothetical protein
VLNRNDIVEIPENANGLNPNDDILPSVDKYVSAQHPENAELPILIILLGIVFGGPLLITNVDKFLALINAEPGMLLSVLLKRRDKDEIPVFVNIPPAP